MVTAKYSPVLSRAVLCLAVVLLGCGGGGTNNTDSTALGYLRRAHDLAAAEDPSAVTYYASAKRTDGALMSDPHEADSYSFWSIAETDTGTVNGAWLTTRILGVWNVEATNQRVTEAAVKPDLTRLGMDVTQAWEFVKSAGLDRRFFAWELFQPADAKFPDAYYAFTVGTSDYVLVDALTGAVTEENHDVQGLHPMDGFSFTVVP